MSKIENEVELEELRHKNKMEEIDAEKKAKLLIENRKFDHEMQLLRIKSAEIKRSIMLKRQER